jgi:hypothetical protein
MHFVVFCFVNKHFREIKTAELFFKKFNVLAKRCNEFHTIIIVTFTYKAYR